jgi:hypothetical protein
MAICIKVNFSKENGMVEVKLLFQIQLSNKVFGYKILSNEFYLVHIFILLFINYKQLSLLNKNYCLKYNAEI